MSDAKATWDYIERILIDECGLRADEGLAQQRPNFVNAIVNAQRVLCSALDEERRKFQQETRRTSAYYRLVENGVELLEHQGHVAKPWPKECALCKWAQEAKALMQMPINVTDGPSANCKVGT